MLPDGSYGLYPISIHALREEGDDKETFTMADFKISIHALREEGDAHDLFAITVDIAISIHALREEGDP